MTTRCSRSIRPRRAPRSRSPSSSHKGSRRSAVLADNPQPPRTVMQGTRIFKILALAAVAVAAPITIDTADARRGGGGGGGRGGGGGVSRGGGGGGARTSFSGGNRSGSYSSGGSR